MEHFEIETIIKSYLAKLLSVDPVTISSTTSFDKYGFDSTAVVGLSGALSDELNIDLDANIAYDFPTVKLLAEQIHNIIMVS